MNGNTNLLIQLQDITQEHESNLQDISGQIFLIQEAFGFGSLEADCLPLIKSGLKILQAGIYEMESVVRERLMKVTKEPLHSGDYGDNNSFNPTYTELPNEFINDDEYYGLSFRAKALLLDLIGRYDGENNGRLSIIFADMRDRGWSSSSTLNEAIKDLIEARKIILTRKGGSGGVCNFYALTCYPVNKITHDD